MTADYKTVFNLKDIKIVLPKFDDLKFENNRRLGSIEPINSEISSSDILNSPSAHICLKKPEIIVAQNALKSPSVAPISLNRPEVLASELSSNKQPYVVNDKIIAPIPKPVDIKPETAKPGAPRMPILNYKKFDTTLAPKNVEIPETCKLNPAVIRLIDDVGDNGYVITAPSLVCPLLFEKNPEKSIKLYSNEIIKIEEQSDVCVGNNNSVFTLPNGNFIQNYLQEIGLDVVKEYLNMSKNRKFKNCNVRNSLTRSSTKNNNCEVKDDDFENYNTQNLSKICAIQNLASDIELENSTTVTKLNMAKDDIVLATDLITNVKFKSFNSEQKKCKLCNFRTKSVLEMSYHLKFPHHISDWYYCNFCKLYANDGGVILYHMRIEHNIRGILDSPVRWNQCQYCSSYECQITRNLISHEKGCARKYDVPGKILGSNLRVFSPQAKCNLFWLQGFDLPNTYLYTSKLVIEQLRAHVMSLRPHIFDKKGRVIPEPIKVVNDRIQRTKHLNINNAIQDSKRPNISSNAGNFTKFNVTGFTKSVVAAMNNKVSANVENIIDPVVESVNEKATLSKAALTSISHVDIENVKMAYSPALQSQPNTIQKFRKENSESLQNDSSVKCELCGVSLKDVNKFIFHLYGVHNVFTTDTDGNKLISCYACNLKFRTHLHFREHIMDVHINKKLTNSSESNIQTVKKHVKEWACSFCFRERNEMVNFLSVENCMQHIRRNHYTTEQKLNYERKMLTGFKITKLNELDDAANKHFECRKIDVATKETPKIKQADAIYTISSDDDDNDAETLKNKFHLKTPCIILSRIDI